MEFRLLTADEIDCRIGQIKDGGLSLLLYKDARCDMSILDETVGAMNWKRGHLRDNANCVVSIWDAEKKEWVSKEDTGTESNTEAEKGLASDSFKRACVNWGIGRELYTAPFIWIDSENCNIKEKNGRKMCNDRFEVTEIGYTDRRVINRLVISANGHEVYRMGAKKPESKSAPKTESEPTFPECAYVTFKSGEHAGEPIHKVWKSDFNYIRRMIQLSDDQEIKTAISQFSAYLKSR